MPFSCVPFGDLKASIRMSICESSLGNCEKKLKQTATSTISSLNLGSDIASRLVSKPLYKLLTLSSLTWLAFSGATLCASLSADLPLDPGSQLNLSPSSCLGLHRPCSLKLPRSNRRETMKFSSSKPSCWNCNRELKD